MNDPELWERLAKLAEMALVNVNGGLDTAQAIDGRKFVDLLRGEAERVRRLHEK